MPGFEIFGEEERREVQEVLETGVLMRYGFDGARKGRWKAREFEKALSEKLGSPHVHAVCNGTAALSTALAALGVGHGDEVIIPTFTFVATFEAVLGVGAIPVLVDVDDTLTLDPDAVRRAITPRTRCIVPVHMCGAMAEMEVLLAICREHKLLLLEDACQSLGATYKGSYAGTLGDAGAFSFDYVKTVTCGEGGAVLCPERETYLRCDAYSDHGHDHLGVDRGADQHPWMGYNYRISELHAAVGLAQLRKLDQILERQRRHHTYLKNALARVPGISFRRIPDESGDACTFLTWMLPDAGAAQAAIAHLQAAGALPGNFYWFNNNWHYIRKWDHLRQVRSMHPLSPEQSRAIAEHASKNFSASDAVLSRSISTLIHLNWTAEQLEQKARQLCSAAEAALNASARA